MGRGGEGMKFKINTDLTVTPNNHFETYGNDSFCICAVVRKVKLAIVFSKSL